MRFLLDTKTVSDLIRHPQGRVAQRIGGNDLLIAAQAVTLGLTLVTDNEREFGRIDELPRENWLGAG